MTRYHELLGVAPDASEEELKKAYRELVQIWHPDRFAHDAKLQKKAQEKFQEINQAFQELSKPGGKSAAPSAPSAFTYEPAVSRSRGGPWPIFAFLAVIAALLVWLGVQSASSPRSTDPKQFTQEADAPSTAGPRRYSLNSSSGKGFYIIEGPRLPLDWEIDALVDAYTSHSPKTRQSVGQFTISQTQKPGDKQLTPLRYRVREQ